MPKTSLETTQKAIEDFKKIQEYMLLAEKDNFTKTYAKASLIKQVLILQN